MPTLLLLPDGQGQIPPASVIAGWPTVNKVYLEPAPKDADRSHCWRCQSKERRVKWCGSLEQVLCDTCLKECEVEIKSIQAAERKRRGLPEDTDILCTNYHMVLERADQATYGNEMYRRRFGQYATNHDGVMPPVTQDNTRHRRRRDVGASGVQGVTCLTRMPDALL